MERKLIKQGVGGLTFYVPSKWIKERSLEAGDLIQVEEAEDKLVLSSKKTKKKQEIEISLANQSKEFIRNYLNQLYRLGYDKIKINSDNKDKLLLCQKFSQMFLLGFETTDVKGASCVIENISEPSQEKESAILRRIFLIIEDSFKKLLEDLNKTKPSNKEEIDRNTRKVTQYDNFLRRAMVKQNLAFGNQFFSWELYNYLLLLQHSFFHLYDELGKFSAKGSTLELVGSIEKNFLDIYEAFFKKDIDSLDKLQNQANQVSEKVHKLIERATKEESLLYFYLGEMVRLQYLICSPIISLLQTEKS